ncbi:hypothetical protein IT084_04305 [Desulfallas sp. Bu1-1]|uniref:hypothetical protein n=1 Tax=Desulfallas sp. Bu1-1 TaxID=2787620 RepID=UPI00189F7112|nr:hypothetical protein [Desulfallas sp. Bu1-1]MBF7082197.1 hypothetical protein [Desulfallas sp. Bu1-1]
MASTGIFKGQNDDVQQILTEILTGLKTKFIQPVLNENSRLLNTMEELKIQDRAGIEELKDRVSRLEQKVEEIPLLVLTAIRDAVNQASEGV